MISRLLQRCLTTGCLFLLLQSLSSVPRPVSAITVSVTTSGPDSALPASAKSPPKGNATTIVSAPRPVEDLAESQSSDSGSVVHAPLGHSSSAFQQEQYRHFLKQSSPQAGQQIQSQQHSPSTVSSVPSSGSSGSQVTSTPRAALSAAPGDTQPQRLQPTSTSMGAPVDLTLRQQHMALMRAKPGQFTLVSNQQVGPGHVTMIGYTTPIVKVGGIVKMDQIAPGQSVSRHQGESSAAAAAPPSSGQAASASSAIYTSAGASSSMYNSPAGGLSHHSQMITHNVHKPQQAPAVSHDLRVGTHASLAQAQPESSRAQQLSASPAAYYEKASSQGPLLPPGYSFAPPDSQYPFTFDPQGRSAKQQVSPQLLSQQPQQSGMGGASTFLAPMEKPKPFLVYKPGFEKLRAHQASFPQAGPATHMVHQPQPQSQNPAQQSFQMSLSSSPLTPISMASLGQHAHYQGKAQQFEKHQNFGNILPIRDLDSNEVGGPMTPNSVTPPFDSQRTHTFPPQTVPQIVSPPHQQHHHHHHQAQQHLLQQQQVMHDQQQHSMNAHLAQARPISISKQMTMDALAQQRSHILSHPRPQSQQQPQQQQQQQFMAPPSHQQQQSQQLQLPTPQMAFQPKGQSIFGGSIESQLGGQFAEQQQHRPQGQQFGGQGVQQFSPGQQGQAQFASQGPQFSPQQSGNPFLSFQGSSSQGPSGFTPQQGPSPFERSAKLRLVDQSASAYQIPQPRVTSSIRMPEATGDKVDTRQELQDQINFVLQNSPNLSENSRNLHRSDIMKAVQESLAESDNSRRVAVASPKSAQSQVQQGNSFELGGGLSFDNLISGKSYSSRPESSSENGAPRGVNMGSSFSAAYKQTGSPSMAPSSRFAPESSYFSRYNQESNQLFPSEGSMAPSSSGQATHSAAQASDSLSRDYSKKLQTEIQRYIADQVEASKNQPGFSLGQGGQGGQGGASPVNYISGPSGPVFSFSSAGAVQQSPSYISKYQSSPLRKVVSMIERPQGGGQSMLYNSEGGSQSGAGRARPEASSNAGPERHFVLGRQTEFVQSQASQPASTKVAAPSSVSSSGSASTPKMSSAQKAAYSELMSSLAQAASSAVASLQPEASKTLRGYSEWWKDSATAAAAANRQQQPVYSLATLTSFAP